MTYNSLNTQVQDVVLMGRINAAAMKEALANDTFTATDFGQALIQGQASSVQVLAWPVCVDTEAPYAYALGVSNPNPGGDPGVISDAEIQSAVQVHWPPDPWPTVNPWPPTMGLSTTAPYPPLTPNPVAPAVTPNPIDHEPPP